MANSISKALKVVPPFSINYKTYRHKDLGFAMPLMHVDFQFDNFWTGEIDDRSIAYFDFLCEGEEMPTEEQLLKKLQQGYNKLAEDFKLPQITNSSQD